jgi:nucleotide-binding universal stress UspA family protein
MNTPLAGSLHVCCAYDGSVNAHWVARYALRMAAASSARVLRLIHVESGEISRALLARKLQQVRDEAAAAGVEVALHSVRATRPVADAVMASLPAGAASVLLCGTRARARARGLLAGTVSHALLRRAPCHVLALRVVHPGVMGAPRRLLLPVHGHPGEGRALAPLLALLAADADELHLLRVMLTDERVVHHAPLDQMARLRAHGRAAVAGVEHELHGALALGALHVDAYVRIAESWHRQVLVTAGQHRCELILTAARPDQGGHARELEALLAHTPCDVGIWSAPS